MISDQSIPKILHRMWLDKNISSNTSGPKKYDKFVQSFDTYNPEFETKFWSMTGVKELFKTFTEISKYETIWYNLPSHIQKCDMARFIVIYLFGGIYIDLDFLCFRNLSPLLDGQLLLVSEPPEHSDMINNKTERRLYNGFIGSVARHPFWIGWLDFICQSLLTTTDVMYTSGPVNFGIYFRQSVYQNIETVSTCDILPIYIKDGSINLSQDCRYKNGYNISFDDNYHTKLGNYVHTKWMEGSGWGAEQLADDSQYEEITGNKTESYSNSGKYVTCSQHDFGQHGLGVGQQTGWQHGWQHGFGVGQQTG